MGHEVFNPGDGPDGLTYRQHMACDLEWICQKAQAMVMLPGWRSSPGAKAEHALAVALKLDIYFWPHDVEKLKP